MKAKRHQDGFLLIAVLVIVMLASMVALSLIFRVRAEQASFAAATGAEQAWHAAMSGVQQAMHLVKAAGPDRALWQDNPGAFRHQLVLDEGSDRWFFSIYSPAAENAAEVRFGLMDENAKLNLNKATAAMLQKVGWLSPIQVREIAGDDGGLSNVVSPDLLPSISSRLHFSTFDELLRLPGVTPGTLYGEDANRNFRLDPNEDDGRAHFPPDDSDGQLFLGLQETGTVFSYEFNRAQDGSERFQLNSTNRTIPEGLLPEATAAYLQAAWSNNVVFKSPAELLEEKPPSGDEIGTGVGPDELPLVLDQLTASFEERLVGLININTAGVKVLRVLPGIDEAKAEAIFAAREGLPAELRGSTAWLVQEGLLTATEFKAVAPLITARSFQYRFHVIGYGIPSGRFKVYEVVIDAADQQPQIMYLRDISRHGLPFLLPAETEELNAQTQPQA